jgi:hypothetical protein
MRTRLTAVVALVLGLLGAIVVPSSATAAAGSDVLLPGETLRAGQSLAARSTRQVIDFDLDMQGDGNLVLYQDYAGFRVPVWSSQTEGNPGAFAVMQGDGNLVVYAADGRPLWHSATHGRAGASLALQSDGNLVLYAAGRPLWQTRTYVLFGWLNAGERLLPGQDLVESQERYRVVMQGDGNLVAYGPGGPYFSTGTQGHPGASLVMQGDGNLVLYDADGATPLWWTGTHGRSFDSLQLFAGGSLVLLGNQVDGALVVARGPEPLPDGDV